MRRLLTDAPQIDGAADLDRRPNFEWSVPFTGSPRRCTLLAVYRPLRFTPCGLCGARDHTLFLVRFLGGLETILGDQCCAHRYADWSQQESLIINFDMLKSERAVIRRTLEDREYHLERAYGMLGAARRLRDAKFDFESAYPEAVRWQIGQLAMHPRPELIEGVEAWDGDAHATVQNRIALLNELEHVSYYDDDPDPEADPAGYVRYVAQRCQQLPETFAAAEAKVEAGRKFFAPANLERLPDLLKSAAEREEVRRITAGLRLRRA